MVEDWKIGRGRLEGWKIGGLEGWTGGMEGWKVGRELHNGREEGWKIGGEVPVNMMGTFAFSIFFCYT